MSDTKELFDATPEEKTTVPAIMAATGDALLAQAMTAGNIDILKQYIDLRNKEAERTARLDFENAFSRMRAELPAVAKRKDNGATKSKYAPIEDIQRACDPVIHAFGFSYSWREEAIPEGKRVWMDISGYGHTRSNFFDCPKISGNNAQNAIQVAGAMSTYGRRYTFVSGFGVIVEGEDSDGQISDDVDVLKMRLGDMLEAKDSTGKLIINQQAFDKIKEEMNKPDSDVKRLKEFYKWASKKVGSVK